MLVKQLYGHSSCLYTAFVMNIIVKFREQHT
jgi:hypothetical protein